MEQDNVLLQAGEARRHMYGSSGNSRTTNESRRPNQTLQYALVAASVHIRDDENPRLGLRLTLHGARLLLVTGSRRR